MVTVEQVQKYYSESAQEEEMHEVRARIGKPIEQILFHGTGKHCKE